MHTTSASLLERLREPGAEADWDRFVRLYTPLLFAWGRRAGLSQAEAEDLAQDVLLALLEELPKFAYDRGRSFRGWLRAVTLNRWRNLARRKALGPGPAADGRLDDVPAASDSLFEETEYRKELLQRAMEQLRGEFEPGTWTAFLEHGLGGSPAAEVAARLETTPGAVYAAKFRVLSRLRAELRGLLD